MKYLKLSLALLLLVCIAIPILVACNNNTGTPDDTGAGETTAPIETDPLVYGEILTDKTEFTLSSGDSTLGLQVKDGELFIVKVATKADGSNRASAEPLSFSLPTNAGTGKPKRVEWSYVGYMNYLPENAKNGQYGYIFRFANEELSLEYDLVVTAHSKFVGPFEFTGYLNNKGEDIEFSPGTYFRASVQGEKTPTAWTFNKESGIAEGFTNWDGQHFSGTGIYKNKLSGGAVSASYTTNQNHNAGGQIPMIYVDYETYGFYIAHEWTNGMLAANEGKNKGYATLTAKIGTGNFQTTVPGGSTFYMPTVYFGVYDGDVDEGSNVFKRWFLYNKAPEILLKDKNEPLTQQDMQIGLSAASYGIQAIKWDYGWWSDQDVGQWKTNEGLLEVNNPSYLNVMKSAGAKNLTEFVKKVRDSKMTLTVYILTKDTQLDREGVPTSVGQYGHPEWFSHIRITGVGQSADFGNVECVDFFKDYLLNFFKTTGVTTWRSDFEPICRDSDKANRHDANGSDVQYWCSVGFYDIVDYLYANLDYFRYESCCSGGAMKDFSTMRRAVILNCDDSANFQSLKMSFYDSSYCIHPAQLQLPTNAGTYTQGTKYYVGFGDHTYGLRSQMVGAVMLSNWDGTKEADKVSWVKNMGTYNSKVKPLIKYGDLYHVLPRPDGTNWDGLFYVDADAESSNKGLLMVFKPSSQGGNQKNIKLRGLDADTTYKVVFQDHTKQNYTATGAELMETGVKVTFTENYDCDWIWIQESKAS